MKKSLLFVAVLVSSLSSSFAQGMTETTQTTTTTYNNGMPTNVNMGMSVNGQPVMMQTGMPQMTVTEQTTTTTTTTGAMPPPAMAPAPAAAPPPCVIGDRQFEDIKSSISAKTFEDTKVSEAMQIMNTHCLASWQVRDIIMLFTYENNKLVFAQNAYAKTLDPANYYMVNDAFQYPGSINQLNASIGQR